MRMGRGQEQFSLNAEEEGAGDKFKLADWCRAEWSQGHSGWCLRGHY